MEKQKIKLIPKNQNPSEPLQAYLNSDAHKIYQRDIPSNEADPIGELFVEGAVFGKPLELAGKYIAKPLLKPIYKKTINKINKLYQTAKKPGRFGDGKVDVTANPNGTTAVNKSFRIKFKPEFDLYKPFQRLRMKNSDLQDGWIMDGYSLNDVENIENLTDGKLIPLTREIPHITPENAATITPEQWTAAQDAAIARSDMAEAQRLRDLHAGIKGYGPVHEYHGSNKQFKEFKESPYGIYFTPDKSAAEGYARGLSPTKYDTYLNIGDDVVIIDNKGLPWNKIPESSAADSFGISKEDLHSLVGIYNSGAHPWYFNFLYPFGFRPKTHYYAADQLAKVAKEQGKTALKLTNVVDNGKKITAIKNKLYDQHVVFNPNQIKLADAVTYDNSGVRIPLGKRDNFKLNDIRWGLLPFAGVAGLSKYNNK